MKKKFGLLTVFTGPMFSGKTENLIRVIRDYKRASTPILVLRPTIDSRSRKGKIESHKGDSWPAVEFDSFAEFKEIIEREKSKIEAIAIDEIHFLSPDFFPYFDQLLNEGIEISVSGLDRGANDNNLPIMNLLFAYADRVEKLFGVCSICDRPASKTRRIGPDGRPVSWNPKQIKNQKRFVGGKDSYQPFCRYCFLHIIKVSPK